MQQVIDRIKALGAVSVRTMSGIEETIKFPLPKGLKIDAATGLEITQRTRKRALAPIDSCLLSNR